MEMTKTKQSLPDKVVFKDQEKEAKFWAENIDGAWNPGNPVKIKLYPLSLVNRPQR